MSKCPSCRHDAHHGICGKTDGFTPNGCKCEALRPEGVTVPAVPEIIVAPPKRRANYIGAPEAFHLNNLCTMLNEAFGFNNYLVGSSLTKRDYRDVDIRCIMDDEEFDTLFPDSKRNPDAGSWVHDAKWSLICASISEWLSKRSGLPIDFQIQRRTQANEQYPSPEHLRNAMGLFIHEANRT